MLPPLPRSTEYMCFFISHSWKKTTQDLPKNRKQTSPPQQLQDSVDFLEGFFWTNKNTIKIRFPDFRFSLPLWKEENLVWQRCKKQAENTGFWDWGPYTHIRSMYGIFSYLWLIFVVTAGTYSIHGSYGLHRLHRTWIIYLADSGALSSPILLENDTSGLFAGCFSCRLYGHPCWWTLFQHQSRKRGRLWWKGTWRRWVLVFAHCFRLLFETNSFLVKTSLICSWAVRARTAHDFHEIQVGGSNPFDSIRFKMGIFPKQTETTTKHAFKSKKHPDIFWRWLWSFVRGAK